MGRGGHGDKDLDENQQYGEGSWRALGKWAMKIFGRRSPRYEASWIVEGHRRAVVTGLTSREIKDVLDSTEPYFRPAMDSLAKTPTRSANRGQATR